MERNRHQTAAMITEATPQDWEDFWYSPEKFGTWYPEDFYNSEPEGREFKDNEQ